MKKIVLNDEKAIGITYFIPSVEFEEGVPCKGTIREVYEEGSVYTGDGEYDGKNFYRQGHGVQDFTNSRFTGGSIGGNEGSLVYKFVGNYDRNYSGWMYGNGVFYFCDQDRKPLSFAKAFYAGPNKLRDWDGDFDYETLLNGFTKDMEIELLPFRIEKLERVRKNKDVKDVDYLIFGDSWTGRWLTDSDRFYKEDFAGEKAINIGIGGTKFVDWVDDLDWLVVPYNPKKVFINLGFNDIHTGQRPAYVYEVFKKTVETLKEKLPNVKIYVSGITHCSVFDNFFERETELNNLIKEYADNSDFVKYIDVNKLFMKDGKRIPDMDDYCIADKLHLNAKGYAIWAPYITDFIKNK